MNSPMTKRAQTELERWAKLLGQLLGFEEWSILGERHWMCDENDAERAYLLRYVTRKLAESGVFTSEGAWK